MNFKAFLEIHAVCTLVASLAGQEVTILFPRVFEPLECCIIWALYSKRRARKVKFMKPQKGYLPPPPAPVNYLVRHSFNRINRLLGHRQPSFWIVSFLNLFSEWPSAIQSYVCARHSRSLKIHSFSHFPIGRTNLHLFMLTHKRPLP